MRRVLPRPTALAQSLGIVLAVLLTLNALLSLYVWAPEGAPWRLIVPIVETVAALWLVLVVGRIGSRSRRRIALVLSGAVVGILSGFSAAEAFFRYFFARSFVPRTDIGMIRGGLLLILGDIGPLADVLTPITIAAIFALLVAAGWGITTGVAATFTRCRAPTTALAVLTVFALPAMLAVGLPPSLARITTVAWFEDDRLELVDLELAGSPAEGILGGEAGAQTHGDASGGIAEPVETYEFPGIADRDIYVFAVEAYGYATVARPEIAERVEPYRDRLRDALASQGYGVRTGYLRSPVAGGYSWLAEATLLTGQWIDSQEKFAQLYDLRPPSLPRMLHEGGYYTFTVRPGTVHGSWPEGWELYRFEEALVAHDGDFGYVGPWFSYVPVTDQYAIWTAHRRIRELTAPGGAAASRPLLAHYQLVSSHTPFNRIPPVIRPWGELGDGGVYHERSDEIELFDNTWTGGTELEEGYVAAIAYVFTVLADYVGGVMDHDRSPIIVVLGDHQPQRPIRSPRAAQSVPVHVASREPSVLRRFEERGFERGMTSDEPPPHPPMSSFFPMFAEIAASRRAEGSGFDR